jgi:MoaA/NifB/PqqE/SkfB family radical SAM enzyme
MEDNIEDLPGFINLVKNTNADEIRLFHLICFAQNTDRWKSEKFKNLNTKLRLTKDLAEREGVKLVATPLFEKPRICTEPWFQPRITLNGDIYPCCYMYITSNPIQQEWYYGVCLNVPQFKYKMGNIFKDSFKQIWNGAKYRLLRETVRKLDDPYLLLPEELNQRRKKIDLKEKFPYCKTCLFRQNCAC